MRVEFPAQLVERAELPGCDLLTGESAERRDERLTRGVEVVHGPASRGCRVVDLMREPRGEPAESDERLALARHRLNTPCGSVQALDEVPAEREPGVEAIPQDGRRHPEQSPAGRADAGRQVDAVLIPGAEAACPQTRHHPADQRPLLADVPRQLDGALDEHPPVIRVLTLPEQLDAGLDGDLGAAID